MLFPVWNHWRGCYRKLFPLLLQNNSLWMVKRKHNRIFFQLQIQKLVQLSLSPHYNTLWKKVIVTLEGLFPSTSLILSKLLYRNQADARCSAKENMPSSSERMRENETEPKGQCIGPNTKPVFVTIHPHTAAPKQPSPLSLLPLCPLLLLHPDCPLSRGHKRGPCQYPRHQSRYKQDPSNSLLQNFVITSLYW